MRLIDADKLHVDKQINGKCWISQEQIINAPTVEAISLSVIEDIKAEIKAKMESIIGKYDSSTPPRDMPSNKCERNCGRQEAVEIIDRKIAEVMKNDTSY